VQGCTADLDPFGDHALCCKRGGEPTIRHNRLTQRIALECSKAVAGVSLEARLLLQKSDDRPADILLTAWRGGAHALDVTVPHVITKRTPANAVGLRGMEEAIARKRKKYFARCQDAGLNFTVLAFDTLGAVHPDTADFLRCMFKDAKERELCPDWKSIPQAWNRVVVPLQIDVARQILTRSLPPTLETLSSPVFVAPAVAGPTITVPLRAPPAPVPLALFSSTARSVTTAPPPLTDCLVVVPSSSLESKVGTPLTPHSTPLSCKDSPYIPSASLASQSASPFAANHNNSNKTTVVPVEGVPSVIPVISFQPIIDMVTGTPLACSTSSRSALPSPTTTSSPTVLYCPASRHVCVESKRDNNTNRIESEYKERSTHTDNAHTPAHAHTPRRSRSQKNTSRESFVGGTSQPEAVRTRCGTRAQVLAKPDQRNKVKKVHEEKGSSIRSQKKNNTGMGEGPGGYKLPGYGLVPAGVHLSPRPQLSLARKEVKKRSVCLGSSSFDYLSPSAIERIRSRLESSSYSPNDVVAPTFSPSIAPPPPPNLARRSTSVRSGSASIVSTPGAGASHAARNAAHSMCDATQGATGSPGQLCRGPVPGATEPRVQGVARTRASHSPLCAGVSGLEVESKRFPSSACVV
jgi:hypothetical protein